MAAGDVIKLQLESIVQGGDALGRFNGKPVFVEGGAPRETVLCRITEEKNSYIKGELLEITESSSERVKSPCAFNNKCGGCSLGHIEYDAQIKIKTSILIESFLRIGGIDLSSHGISIEVFSSPPWEYRNRMQFHCFRQNKNGFGLKGKGSNEIIEINDCPIAVSGIRDFIKSLSLYKEAQNESSMYTSVKSFSVPPEKDRFTIFSKDDVLLCEGNSSRGKIKLLDKEIILDAGLFFQSNCVMLEKLIIKLSETAKDADRSLPMADLYCGVGTFALFLNDLFPASVLAEVNKTAVSIARENLRGVNAEFFALKDTDWHDNIFKQLEKNSLKKTARTFGFVVIDPPRAGLSSNLALTLAKNGHPLLAYVSCDAASLARDSKILLNGGYHLNKLTLFDFYPQTAHIESLAVFKKYH